VLTSDALPSCQSQQAISTNLPIYLMFYLNVISLSSAAYVSVSFQLVSEVARWRIVATVLISVSCSSLEQVFCIIAFSFQMNFAFFKNSP
jgi:hypothetical protein